MPRDWQLFQSQLISFHQKTNSIITGAQRNGKKGGIFYFKLGFNMGRGDIKGREFNEILLDLFHHFMHPFGYCFLGKFHD